MESPEPKIIRSEESISHLKRNLLIKNIKVLIDICICKIESEHPNFRLTKIEVDYKRDIILIEGTI